MHRIPSLQRLLLLVILSIAGADARADVVDSTGSGFTVKNSVLIAATPENVYHHLVADIGEWWNAAHTYSGNSHNLSIDDKAGGCFCEKLEGGGSVLHLRVVFAAPGKLLRLTGGLGPLQSLAVAGTMTWSLSRSDSGTRVDMSYTVGGYRPQGLQTLAAPVNNVLLEQLLRLKNYVEKGKP
jgi:uncharacterized protein YndB with AHSA1/START domain